MATVGTVDLKEPLTPCPVCKGTTNWDTRLGILFCESCDMEWDLKGHPVDTKRAWLRLLSLEN